ncbi:hypothetical protein SAMN04487868_1424 [Marinobacter salarius]|mgnify:CR=1 FL=1|jgi:hypothetical protein|uniref:Uncharacterized protein n=1 Tax=Marinobacter salarius TaxID=1420917 RepID=W5YX67_9GAMM|nr:hypothetical protein [Marinobacter salarius]AHI33499.1 hypothetical protein AU15_22250 [Marinobacter salarius]PHR86155.1 MAG: hypothetical protein COA80_19890 [Leeuwenhoekiella sp.]SFM15381.1 hypothetical protein SAMN04487868_1424 [Marinobacter salarius]HCS26712.1 hypothetical protein [Spongiibacteraceae bacterium]|tara:strand:- start:2122 stop:2598 length:477 start_codon:yes stop_codon:yes gene_type:complete
MQALKFFFLGALLVISTPLFSSTCGSATDMKMLSEEAISCVELFEKLDSKLNFDNGLLDPGNDTFLLEIASFLRDRRGKVVHCSAELAPWVAHESLATYGADFFSVSDRIDHYIWIKESKSSKATRDRFWGAVAKSVAELKSSSEQMIEEQRELKACS